MPCIHRNGEITGYSVRFGEAMKNESVWAMNLSGQRATAREAFVPTDDYLSFEVAELTDYSAEVAAINSAGVGVYSNSTVFTTRPSKCMHVQ